MFTEDCVALRDAGVTPELPDPRAGLHPWFEFMLRSASGWARVLRKFRVVLSLSAPCVGLAGVPTPPDAPPPAAHACGQCGRLFKSVKALLAHETAMHGRSPPYEGAVFGTRCVCCMREFWVLSRLQRHLMAGERVCLTATLANVAPPPFELRASLLAEERAALRARRARPKAFGPFDAPAVIAAGPLPAWVAALA